MTTKHFAPAAWHRPGSPLSLLCPSGLGLSRLGLISCQRLGRLRSRGSVHGYASQRWEGVAVDDKSEKWTAIGCFMMAGIVATASLLILLGVGVSTLTSIGISILIWFGFALFFIRIVVRCKDNG